MKDSRTLNTKTVVLSQSCRFEFYMDKIITRLKFEFERLKRSGTRLKRERENFSSINRVVEPRR